jgi:hypothetical protein
MKFDLDMLTLIVQYRILDQRYCQTCYRQAAMVHRSPYRVVLPSRVTATHLTCSNTKQYTLPQKPPTNIIFFYGLCFTERNRPRRAPGRHGFCDDARSSGNNGPLVDQGGMVQGLASLRMVRPLSAAPYAFTVKKKIVNRKFYTVPS